MRHKKLMSDLSNGKIGSSDRVLVDALLGDMRDTQTAMMAILREVGQTETDISRLDRGDALHRKIAGSMRMEINENRRIFTEKRKEQRETKNELVGFLRRGKFIIEIGSSEGTAVSSFG